MSASDDDQFVKEHEPLVRKIAVRLKGQLDLTTELEDLMAYGFRGLLEARGRFDPTRGVQLKTFAYYRVRGAILDGVRKMAYLPRRAHANRKAAEALDRAAEEVAARRGQAPQERSDAARALAAVDQILGRTSAAFVIAAVGQAEEEPEDPESLAVDRQERERVRAALEVLPERERALIEGHYFGDRTLEEIGVELGISKSWASRLCGRALERMRLVLSD